MAQRSTDKREAQMAEPHAEFWPGSKRFIDALQFASWVHKGQFRKKTSIPYVSHVLAVCSIVIEDGGTENEAIAAFLHDAVEDGEGRKTLDEIRQQFGDVVADLVWDCSDTDTKPKPPGKSARCGTSSASVKPGQGRAGYRARTSCTTRARCCSTTGPMARNSGSGSARAAMTSCGTTELW